MTYEPDSSGIAENKEEGYIYLKPIYDEKLIDENKRAIQSKIDNCISPRLKVSMREIKGFGEDGSGYVIVVRINRSINAPHATRSEKRFSFYSRTSSGKKKMDIYEIRQAFAENEMLSERIEQFIDKRLSMIWSHETPIKINVPTRLVLHMVPAYNFLVKNKIPPIEIAKNICFHRTITDGSGIGRYNFDGFYCYDQQTNNYVQIFTNGVLEAVDGNPVSDLDPDCIPSLLFERKLISSISSYIEGYKRIGLELPIIISVTLMGFEGKRMAVSPKRTFSFTGSAINRNQMKVPSVIYEDWNLDVARAIRPILDSIWNACGRPCSENYDSNGNWTD